MSPSTTADVLADRPAEAPSGGESPGGSGALDDRRAFAIGMAVLWPIYVLPLVVTQLVPGLDLPFHLAMVDMLSKAASPDSPYRELYDGALRISPYLLHLGAVSGLVKLGVSGLLAHKLLVGAYVGALPLSLSRVLAVSGRSRVPALLAFPLAYNLTLLYGFVSFALSVPLLLWTLSFAGERIAPPVHRAQDRRAAVGLLASSMLLFLCHLQNYLFGVAAVVGGAIFCRAPLRRRLLALLCLVPSLLLQAFWMLGSHYADSAPLADRGVRFALRLLLSQSGFSFGPRTQAFHTILLRGFQDSSDHLGAALLMVTLGLYILVGVLARAALWRRAVPVPRGRLSPTAALALLGAVLAYFTLPHHLREYELMTFYPRFAVIATALLTLLVSPAVLAPTWPRASRYALLVPALAMGAWYGAVVTRHFRAFGRETADFLAVVEQVPPGGRAVGLVFERRSRVMENESTLVGLPSYYPVLRPAPGSFVDIVYCGMRHMPCQPREGTVPPPPSSPWEPQRFDADRSLGRFDYVFVRSGPPRELLFGKHSDEVEPIAKAGTWVAYRNKRGSSIK